MLFEDWVKGVVVKYTEEVIDGNKYFFNLDKATNNLKDNSSGVKDFYADHLEEDVDENYLTGIVEYLNQ